MILILSAAYISMLWCGLLLPRRYLWTSALVLIAGGVLFWVLSPEQAATALLASAYIPIAAVAELGILALASAGGLASGGLIRERNWPDLVKGSVAMAISVAAIGIAAIMA